MKKHKLIFAIAIFSLIIVGHFSKLIVDAGFFKTIKNTHLNNCSKVGEVHGPEDFYFSKDRNLLLVSSADRENGKMINGGHIYGFNPNDGQWINLTRDFPSHFSPHGIGAYESADLLKVWAINHHTPEFPTIEVFKFEEDKLTHIETIENENFYNLNDILPISESSFYVTRDHGARSEIGKKFESFSRLGRGSIGYYSEDQYKTVASGISYANGLAFSPWNPKTIVVASMTGKSLIFFAIKDDYLLTKTKTVALPSAPDNIMSHRDKIWIGAHPKLLELQSHAAAPLSKNAPSEILTIDSNSKIETHFQDTGNLISAASVATPIGNHLYIGNIFRKNVLRCDLPSESEQ